MVFLAGFERKDTIVMALLCERTFGQLSRKQKRGAKHSAKSLKVSIPQKGSLWMNRIAEYYKHIERIDYILEHICSALSLESSQVLNLLMKRVFKLNARFNALPSSAPRTAALNNS